MDAIDVSSSADVAPQFFGSGGKFRATPWSLDHVVAELRTSRELQHRTGHTDGVGQPPSREAMTAVIAGLKAAMFPRHYGNVEFNEDGIDHYVGNTLDATLHRLTDQIARALRLPTEEAEARAPVSSRAALIAHTFACRLPAIHALVVGDVHAALAGDPAARDITEVLLCYPGIEAILHHRLAHELHTLGVPVLARLIAAIAHSRTSIDIHPAAVIGKNFFIDHGTGVVIGETAIVGDHVRLYQGVTLGAKRLALSADGTVDRGAPRHPIIEDNVVVYAGATILGRVTIGRGSTIGGNVWLTTSVPPGKVVLQREAR
jgi:serine O-acetyltransferase